MTFCNKWFCTDIDFTWILIKIGDNKFLSDAVLCQLSFAISDIEISILQFVNQNIFLIFVNYDYSLLCEVAFTLSLHNLWLWHLKLVYHCAAIFLACAAALIKGRVAKSLIKIFHGKKIYNSNVHSFHENSNVFDKCLMYNIQPLQYSIAISFY